MTDQPRTYLEPLHDELDRLRTAAAEMGEQVAQYRDAIVPSLESNADGWAKRAELAEARVDQLTDQLTLANDTLRHRGNAVNATGHTNDTLRAKVARAEKVSERFAGNAAQCHQQASLADENGDESIAAVIRHEAVAWRVAESDLRAALADQEPTSE